MRWLRLLFTLFPGRVIGEFTMRASLNGYCQQKRSQLFIAGILHCHNPDIGINAILCTWNAVADTD
jgi:hypothetical protein